MFVSNLKRFWLTDGERGVALAYVGLAVFGAGLAHSVVNNLGGQGTILRSLSGYDIWMILSGAVGADLALYFNRNRIGHAGASGLWTAAIGALLITLSATIIAGTLALPGYGTMFGPFAAFVTFWSSPVLLVFWCIMLIATHMLFSNWRKERETLFAGPPDDGLPI